MKKAPSLRKLPESVKETAEMKKHEYDNRPTIGLTESQLPEIKEWKVGQKYMIEMEVEMTGCNIENYGVDKGKMSGSFKVTKVGVDSDTED